MKHYFALLHPNPSGWDITVPDCPGATASADSVDDAMTAGAQALRMWAEHELSAGRALPQARAADIILNEPDAKADIADGALAASLPLHLDEGIIVRFNVTMDAGLKAALDDEVTRRGTKRASLIAMAVRKEIAP